WWRAAWSSWSDGALLHAVGRGCGRRQDAAAPQAVRGRERGRGHAEHRDEARHEVVGGEDRAAGARRDQGGRRPGDDERGGAAQGLQRPLGIVRGQRPDQRRGDGEEGRREPQQAPGRPGEAAARAGEHVALGQEYGPERGERVAEHVRAAQVGPPGGVDLRPQTASFGDVVAHQVVPQHLVHRRGGGEDAEDDAAAQGVQQPEEMELQQAPAPGADVGVQGDEPVDHPFTDPIMTPFSKYFCRKGYSRSTGSVETMMTPYLIWSAKSWP